MQSQRLRGKQLQRQAGSTWGLLRDIVQQNYLYSTCLTGIWQVPVHQLSSQPLLWRFQWRSSWTAWERTQAPDWWGSEFVCTIQTAYIRHHVELHGHGDDIEADNCRNGEIEILWGDHLVDHQAGAAVVHVVGPFHHLWEWRGGERMEMVWDGQMRKGDERADRGKVNRKLHQIWVSSTLLTSNMPPCEGDFAAWTNARRLSTTFSMSESRWARI